MNDLPYLGFRGGVLARLKGERRKALQGNIPFVILTDLNLGSNKREQRIIKNLPWFCFFDSLQGASFCTEDLSSIPIAVAQQIVPPVGQNL